MHSNEISSSANQGWWRWPLMPLAAIGGALAGSIVAVLAFWLLMMLNWGSSTHGWFFRYIVPVISCAIFGYLYTLLSCSVAPRAKVIAGTVMVTILAITVVVNVVAVWALPRYETGQALKISIGSLATAIAAVIRLKEEAT